MLTSSLLHNHPDVALTRLNSETQHLEIELSDTGHEKLKTVPHAQLVNEIRDAVTREADAIYPVTFSIPIDSALGFIEGNAWPQILSIRQSRNSAELNIWVQQDLRWFDGHFPGHPVLAGVVQTHWVGIIAQRLFGIHTSFQGIENLKFQRIIEPQTQLLLSLEFSSEKQRILFRYSAADGDYSKGRVRFAAEV